MKTSAAKYALLPLLLFCLALPAKASTEDYQTVIVEVIVNTEVRGTFFVLQAVDGGFLVKAEDMEPIGLPAGGADFLLHTGERYVPLASLTGVDFIFHEETVTLELTIAAEQLPENILDFTPPRHSTVTLPRDDSLFFNYGLTLGAGSLDSDEEATFSHELGIRRGKNLLLSDGRYIRSDTENSYSRLQTRLVHDRREQMQRLTIGDFSADSGPLGSQVTMAGVSLRRQFQLDPYYIRYPSINYAGTADTPSEVELFLDGSRIGRETIAPGPFEISNLNRHGGAGEVELVIRDAFGNTRRIAHPFYIEEELLKSGTHDYNYSLGALRRGLGSESDRYEDVALVAWHRYGYNDSLTLAYSAEASSDLINLSPQATYRYRQAGTLALALAGSSGSEGSSGLAYSGIYSYKNRRLDGLLQYTAYSRDFGKLDLLESTEQPKSEIGARFGFNTPSLGSVSLNYISTSKHVGQDQTSWTLNYNRRLGHNWSMFAQYRNRQIEGDRSNGIFAGLTYTPRKDHTVSAQLESDDDRTVETLQLQKNAPVGEGYGYRLELEHRNTDSGNSLAASPYLQYNGRKGILRAEGETESGSESRHNFRVSASGAVVWLGDRVALSRPVQDSFGLVQVGDLENVQVYHNTQPIGRTDKRGQILVPNLTSFYENQISINDQDIPMDYQLPEVRRFTSPPYRSGSCILFTAPRFQPVIGSLFLDRDGGLVPLDLVTVTLEAGGQTLSMETAPGGDFYLEPLGGDTVQAAGCSALTRRDSALSVASYRARLDFQGERYTFDLEIPESEQLYINLGQIIIGPEQRSGQKDRE